MVVVTFNPSPCEHSYIVLGAWCHYGLQSEFKDSQHYTENPCTGREEEEERGGGGGDDDDGDDDDVGIHSANSFLDNNPLGQDMKYFKHRQEVCSTLFFLLLCWWSELSSKPQHPQSR